MTQAHAVERDGQEPVGRGAVGELVDQALAEQVVAQARATGRPITGADGVLRQMTKAVLERSLAAELTEHLGYERGDPAGAGSGNNRNGSTGKRLATELGPIELDVPRDRNGSFEPQTVRKGQRRLDGVDALVLGLYARGLTVRDIAAQLREAFDLDLSPDLLSKITDSVPEEVKDWQARPLDAIYPVIFLDALVCKVRDGGSVQNKAAHLAVGVTVEGQTEELGIWGVPRTREVAVR